MQLSGTGDQNLGEGVRQGPVAKGTRNKYDFLVSRTCKAQNELNTLQVLTASTKESTDLFKFYDSTRGFVLLPPSVLSSFLLGAIALLISCSDHQNHHNYQSNTQEHTNKNTRR